MTVATGLLAPAKRGPLRRAVGFLRARARATFFKAVDGYCKVRDGLLTSPRFLRWAEASPLASFIARRRAAALFDLVAGFVYSQVLFAVVRLELPALLAAGPLELEAIARAARLPPEAARRLLDAAIALRLVERRGDRYGLGAHGASLVGNPEIGRLVAHHALFYRDLADPVALLRGEVDTELGRFWGYARGTPRDVAGYSALMAGSVALVADDALDAYPFARHRALLDVCGGEGAFLEHVAARAPGLDLALFDLPAVASRARDRLARAGLARARVTPGDVFRDPLPRGADLATLVRVLHDHDDERALLILRAIHDALEPGGALLVIEPFAQTRGAEPMGDAYFGFYLLAMGQGRPRAAEEIAAMLLRAGFSRVRPAPTRRPLLTSALVANK